MKQTTVKGGLIIKSVSVGPVMITRARTVGMDKQTCELQLEQMFEPPIGGPTNGALNFFMEGHTAFNSGPRKKVCWQNFTFIKLTKLGINITYDELAASEIKLEATETRPASVMQGAKLYNQELVLRSEGRVIPCKIVEIDTYAGRSWADRNTGEMVKQQPKRAGSNGDVLTRDGAPIYRNSILSIEGLNDANTNRDWDEDLVIVHNNTVIGSTVRRAMAGSAAISDPKLPAGTTDNVSDPKFQDKQPGETGNLKETRSDEPTRTQPGEQVDVASKTKAEEQREKGQRPVGVTPQ